MPTKRPPAPRSGCPIGMALDLIGDPWALLVVRDLMFKGRTAFNDFLRAEEGIATNVLADRLERLTAGGIIKKRRDPSDARRFVYGLTAKGIALAPMLVEMVLWSAAHHRTDAPPAVLSAMKRDRAAFLASVRADWQRSGER